MTVISCFDKNHILHACFCSLSLSLVRQASVEAGICEQCGAALDPMSAAPSRSNSNAAADEQVADGERARRPTVVGRAERRAERRASAV